MRTQLMHVGGHPGGHIHVVIRIEKPCLLKTAVYYAHSLICGIYEQESNPAST